jgi:O-glycosyl hydrolase
VEARVQAPRSLWDTTYRETSWINDALQQPIRLIPRMRDKIKFHYAGTKLAITEWNYGASGHISGAVATADVLGIFGREDVGLAAYWALRGDESFANAAFRAFRNYDGAGAAFGDTSIHAASSDVATATVYASSDAADPDRVVIVAINKTTLEKSADITIDHGTKFGHLQVWTLTEAGAALMRAEDVTGKGDNSFRYTMPPLSVSVLVPGA